MSSASTVVEQGNSSATLLEPHEVDEVLLELGLTKVEEIPKLSFHQIEDYLFGNVDDTYKDDRRAARYLSWKEYIRKAFVLDKLKGGRVLNEVNNGNTLLGRARDSSMPDCLELLLAHGAKPDDRLTATTNLRSNAELRAVLDLHNHLTKLQAIEYTVTRSGEDGEHSRSVTMPSDATEIAGLKKLCNRATDLEVTWFHVPDTNEPVVLSIARAIGRLFSETSLHCKTSNVVDLFLDSFKLPVLPPRARYQSYRDVGYQSKMIRTNDPEKCFNFASVVFPCLTVDTRAYWKNRIKRHTFAKAAVYYLNSTRNPIGIDIERTLDEAYYPGLRAEVLDKRNDDQVIDKQYNTEQTNSWAEYPPLKPEERPILLVPQVWLWKIDQVLVSAYSMARPSKHFTENPKGGRTLMPKLRSKVTGLESMDLQMAYIIADCVEKFGQPYKGFPSTLDLFESVLITTLSDVRNYVGNPASADKKMEKQYEIIADISDIRNELDMIQTIIDQQEGIINDFFHDRHRKRNCEAEGKIEEGFNHTQRLLDVAKSRLAEYTKRISKINRDADRISKTIDDMLNISRTEAGMKEARNSVLIGSAALAFAVVTIIFTPMSFVAALMALPNNRFLDHQYRYSTENDGDTRVYKSGYLTNIFLVAEFATLGVTGLVMYLAYIPFGTSRNRNKEKKERRSLLDVLSRPLSLGRLV